MMNHIMQAINRNQMNIGHAKLGFVTSSNPSTSSIKANLQPENIESGWIPFCTPWIGWYSPPNPGDQVLVLFQEGSKNVPIGALLLYWNGAQPPADVGLGEAIFHHTSGSFIKLNNDGSIDITGDLEINIDAPTVNINSSGDINVNSLGNTTITGSNVSVTGESVTLGDGGATDALVQLNALKAAYDSHVHSDPQGGNTGVPTVPLPNVATTIVKAQ